MLSEIRNDLMNAAAGRLKWAQHNVSLGVQLREARTILTANKHFGEWCADNDFGEDRLNKNERAALIAMAAQPAEMQQVLLEAIDSWSIELTRKKYEARFPSARKTTGGPRGRPPKPKPGERQHQAAVNTQDHDWETLKELANKEGKSAAAKLGELIAKEVSGPVKIEPKTLPMTAQQKLDVAKRQMERKLKAEHAARIAQIEEEIRQRVVTENKAYVARVEAMEKKAYDKIKLYEGIINRHQPPFTIEEFKAIVMCLHPDNSASEDRRAEAFRLFNGKKLQLTKEGA